MSLQKWRVFLCGNQRPHLNRVILNIKKKTADQRAFAFGSNLIKKAKQQPYFECIQIVLLIFLCKPLSKESRTNRIFRQQVLISWT